MDVRHTGRYWGQDLPRGSGVRKLPYEHRRALDIAINFFDGKISNLMPDAFVASVSRPVLRDLVKLGYLRHRWSGYEVTLEGYAAMIAPSERGVAGLRDRWAGKRGLDGGEGLMR